MYHKLLESIKSAPRSKIKRIIFELEEEKIAQIKSYKLQPEIERGLILMQKDRSALDTLLVNALIDDSE